MWKLDGHLRVKSFFYRKPNCTVHMNIFYKIDLQNTDPKIEFLMKTENSGFQKIEKMTFVAQNQTFETSGQFLSHSDSISICKNSIFNENRLTLTKIDQFHIKMTVWGRLLGLFLLLRPQATNLWWELCECLLSAFCWESPGSLSTASSEFPKNLLKAPRKLPESLSEDS